MTVRRAIQGAVILIVIVAAVAWLSGWFASKIPPEEAGTTGATAATTAGTIVIEETTEPAVEWASGAIESARRTTVAARILARIEEVRVAAGDTVALGDVLVMLDARDLESRAQQTRESLKAAQAQREFAQGELARVEELLKRSIATRQRYDQALSALRVAEAEVDRIRQSLAEAETALSFTEIRAPAAGRVIDRLAEPGDIASPGQPLLRLYDPEALRVEAPVRESLAVRLKVGETLRIKIPALDETVEGRIDEIVPFSEPGARTLLVKVGMPVDARFLAGMFARVAIPAGDRARMLVPATAVTRIGQLEFVTIAGEAGAARRMVTTGERMSDGRIEVLSGLRAGERVLGAHAGAVTID